MNVLALDTSGDVGSVALVREGSVHDEELMEPRRHGVSLGPACDRVLLAAGVEAAAIDAVAVGIGPGSYTGTRIGVSFAKTLAFVLDVPLVGLPGLMAVAHEATGERVVVVAPGHRDRVYGAVFGLGGEIPEPERPVALWSLEELLAGMDGVPVMGGPERPPAVRGGSLGALAIRWLAAGREVADPRGLEPLYLQLAAAER